MDSKLKNKLRKIFNKHDPIGIYFGRNMNFDEYDPEIKQLPSIFYKARSRGKFQEEFYELFVRMFFKNIVGNKVKYKKLAKEVYDLLKVDKDESNRD